LTEAAVATEGYEGAADAKAVLMAAGAAAGAAAATTAATTAAGATTGASPTTQ
jgi:hypothetical protein